MRFYRALLHLYPNSFRTEYGAEILFVIAARRAAAGPGGRLALAAETVKDTMTNALGLGRGAGSLGPWYRVDA